jgi:hypothetical protein
LAGPHPVIAWHAGDVLPTDRATKMHSTNEARSLLCREAQRSLTSAPSDSLGHPDPPHILCHCWGTPTPFSHSRRYFAMMGQVCGSSNTFWRKAPSMVPGPPAWRGIMRHIMHRTAPHLAPPPSRLAGVTAVAQRAARLAKADLASSTVMEMTALAGTMGRHFAQRPGPAQEPPEVAQAIFEAALPRQVRAGGGSAAALLRRWRGSGAQA